MERLGIQLRKAREDEGGFTLIELLIVIVILGILAAVVVFAVSGVTDKGSLEACKADAKTIDVAAEAYYAQTGLAAANLGALVTAGFLHKDSEITGNTKTVPGANGYTITFTTGDTTSPAGDAQGSLSGCP